MASTFKHILSKDDILYISSLPDVLKAKLEIDAKTNGSVYFSISLPNSIKIKLLDGIGLDLRGLDDIPMRWIKGDTVPHVDRGPSLFENTYLLYLTSSEGNLVLDDITYPITEGTAYVFNEGLRHGTVGTGSEPRLMLGPMNELGQAVGIFQISGPGGTTAYIREASSIVEYSYDQITWDPIYWPCALFNTSTSDGVFTIEFITDITLTTINDYFYIFSDQIQIGSKSLKNDGTRPIITVDGVANYPGLVKNGDGMGGAGNNNIYVYNIVVSATGVSTLPYGGGWIGQAFFANSASNNYIINCSSDGDIFEEAGGIIGGQPGSVTVIGCSSSGAINQNGGGIIGRESFTGATITCISCWSTGSIGQYGGGIVGNGVGTANIQYCYSTGTIGQNAGGICGSDTGITGRVLVDSCYSTGNIDSAGGGIVGYNSGDIYISNCYSLGSIAANAGGILGSLNAVGVDKTIINCYVTGVIAGSDGYIVGGYTQETGIIPLSFSPPSSLNLIRNYSEDKNGGSGWNTTNANNKLQGVPNPIVGTIWVATTINQPFELFNMGYTPYITNIIVDGPTLIRTFGLNINVGNSGIPAIIAGKSYTKLQINGGDSGSYSTITVDSTTGTITTTAETVPATYTIYIRNNGSYNITVFELTVSSGGSSSGAATTCCPGSMILTGIDYENRNKLITGNILIGQPTRREPYSSYSDYLYKKMAYATNRY